MKLHTKVWHCWRGVSYCSTTVNRIWSFAYFEHHNSRHIPVGEMLMFELDSDGCSGHSNHTIAYLEHVQVVVSLNTTYRGEVELFLTSPMGTESTLVSRRPIDESSQGFDNWVFMSTHCWGESPIGKWKLAIKNHGTASEFSRIVFTILKLNRLIVIFEYL